MRILLLGFGSWGMALALHIHRNGHRVAAWMRDADKCARIKKHGVSEEYLPGVRIGEIELCSRLEAVAPADVVIFAAGSKATRALAEMYRPFWKPEQILVSASKGLEPGTNKRLSQVVLDVLPEGRVVAISGPCHAEELVGGAASAYVAASDEAAAAEAVQDLMMSKSFRVYTNPDIIGVELGGALKNCIAISVGICDGMGHGDNARAALITRGIAEISRLGVAMGARPETFSGLTGIGDLVVTCTSSHSRNRRAGYLLGQGLTLREVQDEIRMIVEGVNTAAPALTFAKQLNVHIPIITELNQILYEGKDPKTSVKDLMERDKRAEH